MSHAFHLRLASWILSHLIWGRRLFLWKTTECLQAWHSGHTFPWWSLILHNNLIERRLFRTLSCSPVRSVDQLSKCNNLQGLARWSRWSNESTDNGLLWPGWRRGRSNLSAGKCAFNIDRLKWERREREREKDLPRQDGSNVFSAYSCVGVDLIAKGPCFPFSTPVLPANTRYKLCSISKIWKSNLQRFRAYLVDE